METQDSIHTTENAFASILLLLLSIHFLLLFELAYSLKFTSLVFLFSSFLMRLKDIFRKHVTDKYTSININQISTKRVFHHVVSVFRPHYQ